jgi:hypothetical protein
MKYVFLLAMTLSACGLNEDSSQLNEIGSGDIKVGQPMMHGVGAPLKAIFSTYLNKDVCAVNAISPAGHGLLFGTCSFINSFPPNATVSHSEAKGLFLLAETFGGNKDSIYPNGPLLLKNGEGKWIKSGEAALSLKSDGSVNSYLSKLCSNEYADVCHIDINSENQISVVFSKQ